MRLSVFHSTIPPMMLCRLLPIGLVSGIGVGKSSARELFHIPGRNFRGIALVLRWADRGQSGGMSCRFEFFSCRMRRGNCPDVILLKGGAWHVGGMRSIAGGAPGSGVREVDLESL
jgi:hypothetical protein